MNREDFKPQQEQNQGIDSSVEELANMEPFEEHIAKMKGAGDKNEIYNRIKDIPNPKKRDAIIATLGYGSDFPTLNLDNDNFKKAMDAILGYDEESGESMHEYMKRYAAVQYEDSPNFDEKQWEYRTILFVGKLLERLETGSAIHSASETSALADKDFSEELRAPSVNGEPGELIQRPKSEKQVIRYLSEKYRRDTVAVPKYDDKYLQECNRKTTMLSSYFRGNSFESQILGAANELGSLAKSKDVNFNYAREDIVDEIKDIVYCHELQKEIEMGKAIYDDFLDAFQRGQQVLDEI